MSRGEDLTPRQAWDVLRENPEAVLVDVRTDAEWAFVGVPDTRETGARTIFEQWSTLSDGPDPARFVAAVTAQVDPGTPVLLLCRSGQRSDAAADALAAAGLGPTHNVLDGFEGPLDDHAHRGAAGWRADGLPWRQQ